MADTPALGANLPRPSLFSHRYRVIRRRAEGYRPRRRPTDIQRYRSITELQEIMALSDSYLGGTRKRKYRTAVRDLRTRCQTEIDALVPEPGRELATQHPTLAAVTPYLLQHPTIAFRCDARDPKTIRRDGFVPREEGRKWRPMITEGGESQQLVGTTRTPDVLPRYRGFAVKNRDRRDRGNPTFYAVLLRPGTAIDVARLLSERGSGPGQDNVGSAEISALRIPRDDVLGYRSTGGGGSLASPYTPMGGHREREVRGADNRDALERFQEASKLEHAGRM